MQSDIFHGVKGDSQLSDPRFHGSAERIRIAVAINSLRTGLANEVREHLIGGPLTDDQTATFGGEVFTQYREGAAKELLARRPGPPVIALPGGKNVDGDH